MAPDRRLGESSDTIANLGARLVRALGGEHPTPPLADALLAPALLAGVERIALVVVDSLGFRQLVRALDRGACPHLARLLATGSARLTALRSVVPAGTAAALTTLHTGHFPLEHGRLGFRLRLEGLGPVELLRCVRLDAQGADAPGGQLSAGHPALALGAPTLQRRLGDAGAATSLVLPQQYLGTPLTHLHSDGVGQVFGVASVAECFYAVRELLARPAPLPDPHAPPIRTPWYPAAAETKGTNPARAFVFAYWPALDEVTHRHGPDIPVCDAELAVYDAAWWRERATQRLPRTLVLVTADHGQARVPIQHTLRLNERPDLDALLATRPRGDRRLTYFYAKPGQAGALEAWLREQAGHACTVWTAEQALAQHLLGPSGAEGGGRWRPRLGDVVAAAHEGWKLHVVPGQGAPNLGAHGGLSAEEMEVPLLALRLDG